jgi:hypothetical protein
MGTPEKESGEIGILARGPQLPRRRIWAVNVLNLAAFGLIAFLTAWGTARLVRNQQAVRSVLFIPKFECKFIGGPEELAKLCETWGVRHQAHQLAEAGFIPLGPRLELLWGTGSEEALCWGHPTARTFASIWRFNEVPKLFFVSVSGTRLGVLTANYARPEEHRSPGLVRTGMPGPIREALETHEKILRELEASGTSFDAGADQSASCASSVAYFRNPEVLVQYRSNLRWRIREALFGVLALFGAGIVAWVVYLRN